MNNMEDFLTTQQCSTSEEPFNSITKITQAINNEDLKLIKNEAVIAYTKLELNKIEVSTKRLNKELIEFERQIESLCREGEELILSNKQNRKSLELSSQVLFTLKQEYEHFKIRAKEERKLHKATYDEYLEKYKKARHVYETHHPEYKKLKQLEIEDRKIEIKYKILQQKIIEEMKRIRQRREINRQIFSASIVKFVKGVVSYSKNRDLVAKLKEAERQEQEMLKQLQELELLAAKKEREMQQTKTVVSTADGSSDTSLARQFNLPAAEFVPPSAASYSSSSVSYSSSSFPIYSAAHYQEMSMQIRNRCEQRRQQWAQRPSFFSSPNKRQIPFATNSFIDQKRPLLHSNLPAQTPVFKQPKINVIDVQKVASKGKPPLFNQHQPLKPEEAKENKPTATVMSKKITAQNLSQQNIFPQPQSEGTTRNILRSLTNTINAIPERVHHANTSQKSILPQPQDNNKLILAPPLNVSKIAPQGTPRHFRQAPQNYFSQNSFVSPPSQQLNNSLASTINQATSQEMQQLSQATCSYPQHFFSPPHTQQDNKTLSNSKKAGSQELPCYMLQTPQNYIETNIFSPPQSQDNRNSVTLPLNISKVASTAQLIYRSETEPSQSQCTSASQHNNNPTPSNYTEPCTPSQSGMTPNLTHMRLTENQPVQNKAPNDAIETSQSSTFSQKCHELTEILAKDIPDMDCGVPSAPSPNPNATEVITSPFFNKAKIGEEVPTGDNNTMQVPAQIHKEGIFGGRSIEELLGNSALFHDQEMPCDSSFMEESQPIFSPEFSMTEEADENTQVKPSGTAPAAFSFNFGQSQSAESHEKKSFFSNATNLFNVFS